MSFRSASIRTLLLMGTLCLSGIALADDVRLFVRHEVADYATWRKAYDSPTTRSMQKKGGVFAQSVYQGADDPNDVTVIHDFHSLESAKAFAASPDLKAAMEKAGVKNAPTIWYAIKRSR